MNRAEAIKLWFSTVFLVAIPVLVHVLFEGAYVVNPDTSHRTFWIGPVSTTTPYLFLAILFLAHCGRLKSKSRRSAYCGAVMAWLGMMGFTIFLVFQTPGPQHSSTMGIAVALTPFCYVPFLFVPYFVGTVVGTCWNDRYMPCEWNDNKTKP
jgi:hypothetical protein